MDVVQHGGESFPRPVQRPRILLVDDHPELYRHLTSILADEFVVDVAGGGAEALEQVHRALPEVVLADVVMPGIDGMALLKALRTNPLTCAVPVILLSGRADEEARVQAFELAADGYLIKPFTLRELRARIRAVVENTRLRATAPRTELAQAERAATQESVLVPARSPPSDRECSPGDRSEAHNEASTVGFNGRRVTTHGVGPTRFRDGHLDGYTVSDRGKTVVLHLRWDYPGSPQDPSNIRFSDVALYHFTHTSGAKITDVEETSVAELIENLAPTLAGWNRIYGLRGWRTSAADYATDLQAAGLKAWRIHAAVGFAGFIIARAAE